MSLACLNYFNQSPIFDFWSCVIASHCLWSTVEMWCDVVNETSVSLTTSELEEYSEDNVARKHSRFYEALQIQPLHCEKTILRFQQQGLTCSQKNADPKILRKYPEISRRDCPLSLLHFFLDVTSHICTIKSFNIPRLSTRAYHSIQSNNHEPTYIGTRRL